MTVPARSYDDESVGRALSSLRVAAPPDFAARIFASWIRVPGPVGPLFVACTDQGISYVRPADALDDDEERFAADFRDRFGRPIRPAGRPPAGLAGALRSGRSGTLTFDLRGLSEFERAVLRKTVEIPPGETRPYAWIAHEIGHPRAMRAAGSALGRNPVPILIPCHRVVRSDGEPGEYALGRQLKQELLSAEHVDLSVTRRLASDGIRFLASDATGVVCYPTCRHARRIPAPHGVGFRTLERAVAAGYHLCGQCRPALRVAG